MIRFTQDYRVKPDGPEYAAGAEHGMSRASEAHFVNKGVAVYVEKREEAQPAMVVAPPVEAELDELGKPASDEPVVAAVEDPAPLPASQPGPASREKSVTKRGRPAKP